MVNSRHSETEALEAEAPEERLTRWYLRVRDSRWLGWAAPLLKHLRGIGMAVAGIAAVGLAALVSWSLLVWAADGLAHHDVGSAKEGELLQTARDAARGRLLTLGAGLFAAGALIFTARTFALSRQGQVTDRYTKAIEQLGETDKLDMRLGGICSLERVARDSARDHPTVMEVLTAFIRRQSHEPLRQSCAACAESGQSPRPDVQAALTVVGRRASVRDIRPIDLTGANLAHAKIPHGVDLVRAHLDDVNCIRVVQGRC
jgi:hypothetical protein